MGPLSMHRTWSVPKIHQARDPVQNIYACLQPDLQGEGSFLPKIDSERSSTARSGQSRAQFEAAFDEAPPRSSASGLRSRRLSSASRLPSAQGSAGFPPATGMSRRSSGSRFSAFSTESFRREVEAAV